MHDSPVNGRRKAQLTLNLLFTLLRRIANSVPDLSVQLDVFDEQRECDESQSLQGPDGINLNSHLDVFYAILRQVSVGCGFDLPGKIIKTRLVCFRFVTGGRHSTRDSVSEYFATFVEHRAKGRDKRHHLGHGRDAGPPGDAAGEPRGLHQAAEGAERAEVFMPALSN